MPAGKRPPGRPRFADLHVPTRDAILEAAGTLFLEAGYRAVTMDMVADAAGLTKAAVYYHFKDKPALVVASVCRALDRAGRSTAELLTHESSLRDRLKRVFGEVLAYPQPFTRFDSVMRAAASEISPDQFGEIMNKQQEIIDLLDLAIAQAIEQGEIRNCEPTLITHALLALLYVGQAWDTAGHLLFPDAAATAATLIDTLWTGLENSV